MRVSNATALCCLLLARLAHADVSLSADHQTLLVRDGTSEAASAITYHAFCTGPRFETCDRLAYMEYGAEGDPINEETGRTIERRLRQGTFSRLAVTTLHERIDDAPGGRMRIVRRSVTRVVQGTRLVATAGRRVSLTANHPSSKGRATRSWTCSARGGGALLGIVVVGEVALVELACGDSTSWKRMTWPRGEP